MQTKDIREKILNFMRVESYAPMTSEELVDALLASGGAHPLYQDVDGALYVLPTSRERDESKGQADIQI